MNQLFALIPASVFVSVQPQQVAPFTLTADRLWANLGIVLALVGVVSGGMALARLGKGSNRAIVALVAGIIAAIIGWLLLATADGGPGTGNGVIGAVIALLLGLIAVAEGALFLLRSRRVG